MDKTTVETYNQLAAEYDRETTSFWERFPQGIIERFIEAAPGKRVLDVGSGPGRDGVILRQADFDATCLDASSAMVQACQNRGLKALIGDFDDLPFSEASFDSVWAYTSLLHTPKEKIDQPLAEISRVLCPDGILGLGMIEGDKQGYRESAGVNKPRWFSYYTEAELRTILKKQGFEILAQKQ